MRLIPSLVPLSFYHLYHSLQCLEASLTAFAFESTDEITFSRRRFQTLDASILKTTKDIEDFTLGLRFWGCDWFGKSSGFKSPMTNIVDTSLGLIPLRSLQELHRVLQNRQMSLCFIKLAASLWIGFKRLFSWDF